MREIQQIIFRSKAAEIVASAFEELWIQVREGLELPDGALSIPIGLEEKVLYDTWF